MEIIIIPVPTVEPETQAVVQNSPTLESFHVPPGVGRALIAAGVARQVMPVVTKPTPQTRWRPLRAEGGMYPPALHHSCSSCGMNGTTESQRGTAHISARFCHCGVVDTCPEDVAELYLALYREWES